MKTGRKGLGEELRIKERYSALTEPFFKVLKEFLESEDKTDRKFAVTELNKGFTKMIPTELTGEEGEAIQIVIGVSKEGAEKYKLYESPSSTSDDPSGPTQV